MSGDFARNSQLNRLPSSALVTFCLLSLMNGQDGSLDTSFDTDGLVTTDFFMSSFDRAKAVAIQSDGKIVVAGESGTFGFSDFALARYNTDGSLDTSFDADGLVTTNFLMGSSDIANAIALQPDGKILVAGFSTAFGDFALARYNTDGSLDTSFDADGLVTTDFSMGSDDRANAIALQPDGKILVAGETDAFGSVRNFALARYNMDGSLDTSFDVDGLVVTDFSMGQDCANAISVQPDGKILVAGESNAAGLDLDFALARYNTDGSLDTSFDADGLVVTDFSMGSGDSALAVAIQLDARIVLVGRTGAFGSLDFALARYNSDGSLDTSFDVDGLVTTGFSIGSDDRANAIALQLDGKILVAGRAGSPTSDFALARYNTDGSLDTSFDADGLVTTDFSMGSPDVSHAVALQVDGKIVAAGETDATTCAFALGTCDFALARYNSSLPVLQPGPAVPIIEIPTLSTWGLVLLGLALAAASVRLIGVKGCH